MKYRVKGEIREHFIDEWAKLNKPYEFAEKLDEYESVRTGVKPKTSFVKTNYPQHNSGKFNYYSNPQVSNRSYSGRQYERHNNPQSYGSNVRSFPNYQNQFKPNSQNQFKPNYQYQNQNRPNYQYQQRPNYQQEQNRTQYRQDANRPSYGQERNNSKEYRSPQTQSSSREYGRGNKPMQSHYGTPNPRKSGEESKKKDVDTKSVQE